MSFKLSKTNEFETKVEVITPVMGGEEETWSFMAKFEMKPEGSVLDDLLISVRDFSCEVPANASKEELLELVKSRSDSKNAIVKRYREVVIKKNQANNFFG